MGKIIMVGSQKGGIGKTVTTFNLAHSLRETGKKVLSVDFDSQANLITCYGVDNAASLDRTIGHLMMAALEDMPEEDISDYIMMKDGVDFIPSSIYLSVADAKLRLEMGAERMLSEILGPLRKSMIIF